MDKRRRSAAARPRPPVSIRAMESGSGTAELVAGDALIHDIIDSDVVSARSSRYRH